MAASQSGHAPQVGEEFDSYDELKERVFNHGKATHVQFVIEDSRKVESANKTMGKTASKYPDKFVYRYVKLKCKHGGTHTSKSKGNRPNQR